MGKQTLDQAKLIVLAVVAVWLLLSHQRKMAEQFFELSKFEEQKFRRFSIYGRTAFLKLKNLEKCTHLETTLIAIFDAVCFHFHFVEKKGC